MEYVLILALYLCATLQGALLEGIIPTPKSQSLGPGKGGNECSTIVSTQYGYFHSPGYPEKYPRYARCQYIVEQYADHACEVKLTFEVFDVAKMSFSNCSEDFLEIQNREQRFKLCGELEPGSKRFVFFPKNSNQLMLKFQSTFHQRKGFTIQVKQLPFSCIKEEKTTHASMRMPPSCFHEIVGRIGRITFPNTPDDRTMETKCTYKIRRSEFRACVIQLDFLTFEVTQTPGCSTDFLLMPDGQKLCGVLGGSRKLLQFLPDKDDLVLELISSGKKVNTLDIQITQLPGPCNYGTSATGTSENSVKGNALE